LPVISFAAGRRRGLHHEVPIHEEREGLILAKNEQERDIRLLEHLYAAITWATL